MKPKLTLEQKEAQSLLKSIENKKAKMPGVDKNILEWDMNELRTYIEAETRGLSKKKKLKFAKDLMERIREEKRLAE